LHVRKKAAAMGLYARKCLQALLISEGCTPHYLFIYLFSQKEPFDWSHHQCFWRMGHSPNIEAKICFPPQNRSMLCHAPLLHPTLQATIFYILQDQCSPPYFISLGLEFRDTSRVWTRISNWEVSI
jgi:hypothetical protein